MSGYFRRVAIGIIIAVEGFVLMGLWMSLSRKLQPQPVEARYVSRLNKDSYIGVSASLYAHYYEPKPNERIDDHPEWLERPATYTINSDALNERMEYQVVKADHVFRIITIGDSFTYGLFVNTSENYSEVLEDLLNSSSCSPSWRFEVINLGVPGYDIAFAAERFRLRGKKYDPDLVIWFMNPFTFLFNADRKSELEQEYVRKVSKEEIRKSATEGEYYLPGRLAWDQHMQEVSDKRRIAEQTAYFSGFSSLYQGPLLIVANEWDKWVSYAKIAVQEAMVRRPHLWVYDSLPSLAQSGGELADRHPNAKGHGVIASGIYSFLRENRLMPCAEAAP